MARQLLRDLDLIDVETDVVLGGGVLTSRDPLLTRLIRQSMAAEAPKGRVTINEVGPSRLPRCSASTTSASDVCRRIACVRRCDPPPTHHLRFTG